MYISGPMPYSTNVLVLVWKVCESNLLWPPLVGGTAARLMKTTHYFAPWPGTNWAMSNRRQSRNFYVLRPP
jgi:hypothetical protein